MPDLAEQITRKLKTALREESRERRNLNESVSLGVQSTYAKKYVEAHLAVKVLRSALVTELIINEPKLEDLLREETDGKAQA